MDIPAQKNSNRRMKHRKQQYHQIKWPNPIGSREQRSKEQDTHLIFPVPGMPSTSPMETKPDKSEYRWNQIQPQFVLSEYQPQQRSRSRAEEPWRILRYREQVLADYCGIVRQRNSGHD